MYAANARGRAYTRGVGFSPVSISHLTQFLGLASVRTGAHFLQDPRSKIPEVASGLPEWERYLKWLFLEEGGPRREGDRLVLPVRDHRGMSSQVALVPPDTPYGAYHCGYVVAPIPKGAGPGLYLVQPGIQLGERRLPPFVLQFQKPHGKPFPLALVLAEAKEALLRPS